MRNAIDYSFSRPSPSDVAKAGLDILIYTGAAIPSSSYVASMRAAGVGICMVQETYNGRSQEGYSAGLVDAHIADAHASGVGYPTTCSIAYVVSDGNAGDPSTGAEAIAAYAKAIQDSSLRPFFFYGNRYACDAAMRGAPNGLGCWVPSTWGALSSDLIIQEANKTSPFTGTDFNTVQHPYGNWGTFAPPLPQPAIDDEEETMLIINRATNEAAILFGNHRPRKIASVNDYQRGTFVTLDADAWQQYWDDAIALYTKAVK